MSSVLSAHIPDDWPLAAQLAERVQQKFGGKASAYVRSVVERDLSGDSTIPAASDERFLERILESVLPAKASRFGAQWRARQAALTLEEQGNAVTQGEVATALLEAFLHTYTTGRVPAATASAFVVLAGPTWNALLSAALAGDIHGVCTILRANDSSKATITYDFPIDDPVQMVAEPASPPPMMVKSSEALEAKRLAAEHRKAPAKHGSGKA